MFLGGRLTWCQRRQSGNPGIRARTKTEGRRRGPGSGTASCAPGIQESGNLGAHEERRSAPRARGRRASGIRESGNSGKARHKRAGHHSICQAASRSRRLSGDQDGRCSRGRGRPRRRPTHHEVRAPDYPWILPRHFDASPGDRFSAACPSVGQGLKAECSSVSPPRKVVKLAPSGAGRV